MNFKSIIFNTFQFSSKIFLLLILISKRHIMDKHSQSLLQCSNVLKNNKIVKFTVTMLSVLNKQLNNDKEESNNYNTFGVQGITILVCTHTCLTKALPNAKCPLGGQ